MKDVLFVTAFKDIGRSDWNSYYQRHTDEYLSYFGNLLQTLSDNFICFCEEEISLKLLTTYSFKNSYPYEKDNTFYKFLDKEQDIINSRKFKDLVKERSNNPECFSAEYNIVNHNKVIFLKEQRICFPIIHTIVG